jgi:hypothetical protein
MNTGKLYRIAVYMRRGLAQVVTPAEILGMTGKLGRPLPMH